MKDTAIKIDRLLKAGDVASFKALLKNHDQLTSGFSAQCFGKGYYPPCRNSSGELIAGYNREVERLEVPASHGTVIALKG